MAKGYWVVTYKAVLNADKMAAYAKLAGPAIEAQGGKYLVRGMPAQVYEKGLMARVVVTEFPSLAAAVAAHDCEGYKAALKALDGGADREIRIVEGT